MRYALFLLSIICIGTNARGQFMWPKQTNQMKPWTRWWWQGSAVNKEDLGIQLKEMQLAGLGGVEITPIYGVKGSEEKFIEYLSPEWMEMLTFTLNRSRALGLGVDLANGTGWPFGGPWISEPDASMGFYIKTWKISKGETFNDRIVYERQAFVRTANGLVIDPLSLKQPVYANTNLQALAIDQVQFKSKLRLVKLIAYGPGDQKIDITAKADTSGKLNWSPGPGNWELCGLFTGMHGKFVERAAPGGEGYAIDHFSATATRNYLTYFDRAFAGYNLKYLRALFNDSYEVDDARGQANWTAAFLQEFKKRRGYELADHLGALSGTDTSTYATRILYDYRSTIDELLLEHFTITWKNWAAGKDALVRNQSHGSPANTLDLYAAIDIPETEGNDILRFKFASSAANVTGKQLVAAEAATWLNEHFISDWSDVKRAVDLFFLGGVNHVVYHGTAYSPQAAPWPGWLFYAAVHFQPTNPLWKDFHVLNSYVTRMQSFLQTSEPDNDLLVYYPIGDQYSKRTSAPLQHFDGMEKNFEETHFAKLSGWLSENDATFDFISSRQLSKLSFDKTLLSGGRQYQAIVLPGNEYISPEELRTLMALADKGATILVYENMPAKVPGFSGHTSKQTQLDNDLNKFQFKSEGNVSIAAIGKGRFILGKEPASLLAAGKIRREQLNANGISFIRKKINKQEIYMLSNQSERNIQQWVKLSTSKPASSVVRFDPMTSARGLLPMRKQDEATEVYIELAPGASILIQTHQKELFGPAFMHYSESGPATPLVGKWRLQFVEGGPLRPFPLETKEPMPWTDSPDTAWMNFSGSAVYSTKFAKPVTKSTHWKLDLGKVHETAEILLNGKLLTTLIGPDYSFVIPGQDLQPENLLEIRVSNGMANRISYMDRNNLPWKIFYNINMPARKKENTRDGLFYAGHWKPLPSGLGGPVTLRPMQLTAPK